MRLKPVTYPSAEAEKRLSRIAGRGPGFRKKDLAAVSRFLDAVRRQGDQALVDYTRRFDSPDFTAERIRVDRSEWDRAVRSVEPSFSRALNRAARQIAAFHRRQLQSSWMDNPRPGVLLGQMVRPVEAAGVYVPGGRSGETPLVSSVLMGAIPAKIAGVTRIVMATPPAADGSVSPYLLAAARKAGVDEVYRVGSAWAIGALAYGTETIAGVDVVVGPGNIFVTLAKKLVAGTVGIDMVAGPSEILVIADKTARPEYVAADLLSQAEHDQMASAVLVTDSPELARAVSRQLPAQLESLPRRQTAAEALRRYGGIFTVSGLGRAVELANRIAPEHLELMIADPYEHLARLRHAGAVFIGSHSPEPMGDYVAGPNHVLPTASTARFSSALSVEVFMKKTSIIDYSEAAFRREAPHVAALAAREGLEAHRRAVTIRMKDNRRKS